MRDDLEMWILAALIVTGVGAIGWSLLYWALRFIASFASVIVW
jgi:hypothetical protein